MNYELEIQKSRPDNFFSLNGDRPPLVAGSGNSTRRTTGLNLAVINAFLSGREDIPFTLECWYLPIKLSSTAETVVIGHVDEGIVFNGTDFTLRVKYLSQTVEATWTPSEVKSFHVAMVYDTEAFYLYVDGVRVASLDVQAEKFLSTTGQIAVAPVVSGTASGSFDSAAIYYRALTAQELSIHYGWAKELSASINIASALGGTTYNVTYNSVRILQSVTYDKTNWSQGYSINLTDSGSLIGGTGGGTWMVSVPVESIADSITEGVHLTYQGVGTQLSYSTDGTAWAPLANKRTVLEGVSSTDLTLYVKVDVEEDGSLDYLKIDALEQRIIQPFSGNREIYFEYTSLDQTPGHQLDYHVDQGAEIVDGYVEIQPDISGDPINVQTVEVWAKVTDTDGWFMGISGSQYVSVVAGSYTFAGMTSYRNGQPVSNGTQPADEWAHYVFVLNTAANTPIRFGQKIAGTDLLNMSLGHIAVYPQAMTAPEVQNLYNMNIGAPLITVDDDASIGVTELSPSTEFYAYSWTNA